jgi:hypothetical protein
MIAEGCQASTGAISGVSETRSVALTHELDKKDSPSTRWFNDWLPNAKPISKQWSRQVKPVPIVRPETEQRVPGTVGTAFDYRLRYYLEVTPLERLVAGTGLRILDTPGGLTLKMRAASDAFLALYGPPPPAAKRLIELITDFQVGLAATLAQLSPVGRMLNDGGEELLCR